MERTEALAAALEILRGLEWEEFALIYRIILSEEQQEFAQPAEKYELEEMGA